MWKLLESGYDWIWGCLMGTLYRHYKGGLYRRLGDGYDSTNAREGCPVVIYRSLAKGVIRVRDAGEWNAMVKWPDGTLRPRFERLERGR